MSRPLVRAGAVTHTCRSRFYCLSLGSIPTSRAPGCENGAFRSTSQYLSAPKHYQQCSKFHNSTRRRNEGKRNSGARADATAATESKASGIPALDEIIQGTPKYTKGGMERIMRETDFDFDYEMQHLEPEEPVEREDFGIDDQGFFSMGEENSKPGQDEDFQGDEISSTAHAELEYVRELRELFRASAWDMPLLWSHAKPFVPPTEARPLRFRYTTYFGEYHPAARKVVVTFTPSELDKDLTQVQINKMIKLLGPRYNPSTNTAKISCEMFPTVPQNKRWLGDMVDKILAEVKDTSKDTFEDMPFDFRHHTVKKRPEFPEEWKLTEEKRAALVAERDRRTLLESEVKANHKLIDGISVVDQEVEYAKARAQPVTVPSGRLNSMRC